ncbi:MAG: flotillin family protein [Patescibacteria group bacterium]|nr:flotillin family protein [Patescibacteria group bacterium]
MLTTILLGSPGSDLAFIVVVTLGSIVLGLVAVALLASRFYRKVGPEEAIIRSGYGGLKAATGAGMLVIPVIHRWEQMDLSVKRIEIHRKGEQGLICKDNIRADIEVAFFVRVNNTREDILQVAQSLGCRRASEQRALVELFDAKFSEALKTVGKRFNFEELYEERDKFKEEIIKVLGTDLNGYKLDDCAIDYLEQTSLEKMNPHNILDAEGIKKITELTSHEHIRANEIRREKEKTIKKQDVEAREAILMLERQQVEAEEKQKREIAEVAARQQAEAKIVEQQELLKSEQARIRTEEEVRTAEENRDRQIIVAMRNKERTDGVEIERVHKDRELEATERERVVSLAQIERDKAIEVEKRNIQEVIRERVVVERSVVEEQERIKDTQQFAGADRQKRVQVTHAEMTAQEALVKQVKAAEAAKQAASLKAEQVVIEADADRQAAERQMLATKMLAEAKSADEAATGLAEAKVISVKAEALEKQGTAEATVMELKYHSEAKGIEEKANAMKLLDGVGKEHEEFKLRLNKDKDIEIAAIAAQQKIAEAQSRIVGEALKSARIDIVGGETTFFDKIVEAVKGGKAVDRLVHSSETLTDVKNTFFTGNPDYFRQKLEQLIAQFNLNAGDVKDLTVAALLLKMMGMTDSNETRSELTRLLDMVKNLGVSGQKVAVLQAGKA